MALEQAVTHLVGRSRGFLLEIEGFVHEIGSLRDERAGRLMESMRMTACEPAGPGTLRHLETAASELLRRLVGREHEG